MDILKFATKAPYYIKGFFEIATTQTPRYHFVIEKFELTHQDTSIKTRVNYTPVGKALASTFWYSDGPFSSNELFLV